MDLKLHPTEDETFESRRHVPTLSHAVPETQNQPSPKPELITYFSTFLNKYSNHIFFLLGTGKMDDPVAEVGEVIIKLTQGSPKTQERTLRGYFQPKASFLHP